MITNPVPSGFQYAYDPYVTGLTDTLSGQASQLSKGQLPTDVTNQIIDQGAERAVGRGIPGSQAADYSTLRTLGLNSLYGIDRATQMLPALRGQLVQLPNMPSGFRITNPPGGSGDGGGGMNSATSQMIDQLLKELDNPGGPGASAFDPFSIHVPGVGGGIGPLNLSQSSTDYPDAGNWWDQPDYSLPA